MDRDVTTTATPEVREDPAAPTTASAGWHERLTHATLAAAVLWWGLVLTYHGGGRDRWVLTLGIPLALLALAFARPWAVLSGRLLATSAAVVLATVAVCLVDPTHWYAGSQAATYAYSAVLLLAVAAYARTAERRTLVVALVLIVGIAQLGWAFTAWHALGRPDAPMFSRFLWYNQFAAFELAPAVIGLGLALAGAVPLRLLAALAAVLGSAGVVLSTSRASMALLGLGWLAAGVISLVGAPTHRDRLRVVGRAVTLGLVTVGLLLVVTGPPFFDHRASVLGGTTSRGTGQPVTQNGAYRLDFWRQSLHVLFHHVLTGAGFGSFGTQTRTADPATPHAQFAHNGFLQALSDGGLLLGVPFLLGCLGLLVVLARRFTPEAARREYGTPALVTVAVVLLAVHSAVDFDWSYPSSMAEVAILAGLALSWSPVRVALRPYTRVAVCALVAGGSLLLAAHAVPGGWLQNAPKDPSQHTTAAH